MYNILTRHVNNLTIFRVKIVVTTFAPNKTNALELITPFPMTIMFCIDNQNGPRRVYYAPLIDMSRAAYDYRQKIN